MKKYQAEEYNDWEDEDYAQRGRKANKRNRRPVRDQKRNWYDEPNEYSAEETYNPRR